jgi:predicted nucleotidyltransferase
MLASVITNNLPQVKDICQKHHVKKLYVFGSAVREDYQFYSDIDLLVDFEKEEDNNEFNKIFFWFKEELIYAFKKPIDLLFYKKALESKIKSEIEREKVLIYG